MTKRKYKLFLDVLTILLIIAPLIVLLLAVHSGAVLDKTPSDIVMSFSISNSLADRIGQCINTFGIELDGDFYNATCVIMSNALLIYLFRVFVSVLVFLPKLALKFINLDFGGK